MKTAFQKTAVLIVLASLATLPLSFVKAATGTTVSLSPSVISFQQGQTTTFEIDIDPNGAKNYVTSIKLSFPASLASVQSFTQAPVWIPLTANGYDAVDNTSGTFIKTAGYPRGISSKTAFGTVTLLAKGTGSGTVSVVGGTGGTLSFDRNGGNVVDLSNSPSASFVVTPAPVSSDTSAQDQTATTANAQPDTNPNPAPTTSPEQTTNGGLQLGAAAGDAISLSTSGKVVLSIVLFLALIASYILIWRKPKRRF